MYSDLTELNEYINGKCSEDERKKLFREQSKEHKAGKIIIAIRDTALSDLEIANTLRDLQAVLKHIKEYYSNAGHSEETFQTCAVAQAILDLCYNYACEASISNVSKHYNITEFKDLSSENETFSVDFKARFQLYYGNKKYRAEHFLTEKRNDFRPYHFKMRWFCNLKRAEHLAKYANLYAESSEIEGQLLPYEYKINVQRWWQRFEILRGVGKKLLMTTIYLFVAFYIEKHVYEILEKILAQWFKTTFAANGRKWIVTVTSSLMAAMIVELLSSTIVKMFNTNGDYARRSEKKNGLHLEIPTFGECLENVISQLGDLICAIITLRKPYFNRENSKKLNALPREKTKLISFVSKSIADYKQYRQRVEQSESKEWMFGDSAQIPLVDIRKNGEDVRLTCIEELTGKTFGITHKSAFHTMLVDPAIETYGSYDANSDNAIYPYERLVASGGPGIVAVPVIYRHGKLIFILLKQYCHAIRSEQYGFPRGFGERGLTPIRSTQKELCEELIILISSYFNDFLP